jgi:hypothetical protein
MMVLRGIASNPIQKRAAPAHKMLPGTKSIKTIPVDGKPKLITIYHEPENDPKGSDPDAWTLTWIKSQIEIGKAIKAANHPDVVYGPVFMSKYSVADLPATDQASTRRFIQIAEDNGY